MRYRHGFRFGWLSVIGGIEDSMLHQATVLLNDAQIKALPTTSVQVAAPETGMALILMQALLQWDVSVPYTNISGAEQTQVVISATADSTQQSIPLFAGPSLIGDFNGIVQALGNAPSITENAGFITPSGGYIITDDGLAIDAFNAAGDFTGGNAANTLRVSVVYLVFNTTTGLFE